MSFLDILKTEYKKLNTKEKALLSEAECITIDSIKSKEYIARILLNKNGNYVITGDISAIAFQDIDNDILYEDVKNNDESLFIHNVAEQVAKGYTILKNKISNLKKIYTMCNFKDTIQPAEDGGIFSHQFWITYNIPNNTIEIK